MKFLKKIAKTDESIFYLIFNNFLKESRIEKKNHETLYLRLKHAIIGDIIIVIRKYFQKQHFLIHSLH